MTNDLFHQTPMQQAIHALREDLIQDDGPQISTMRNYRFAIVQYDPKEEFKLRQEVRKLTPSWFRMAGWSCPSAYRSCCSIESAQGDDFIQIG